MRLFEMMKYLDVDTKNLKDFDVKSLSTLEEATSSDLVYVDQDKYLPKLSECKAGAVLVSEKNASLIPSHIQAIVVKNPHLAFAYLSSFFAREMFEESGADAKVASSSKVMSGAYLGRDVEIGEDCVIMAGAVIGDRVKIGNGCKIFPNVVLYADTILGDRVSIHAGSVVGSDGFGYAHT